MDEKKIQTNPVKVIREKCVECCCGNMAEVARCPAVKCPLHPWRMGKNPYRKKVERTEEQKKALAEKLAAAKQAKQAL